MVPTFPAPCYRFVRAVYRYSQVGKIPAFFWAIGRTEQKQCSSCSLKSEYPPYGYIPTWASAIEKSAITERNPCVECDWNFLYFNQRALYERTNYSRNASPQMPFHLGRWRAWGEKSVLCWKYPWRHCKPQRVQNDTKLLKKSVPWQKKEYNPIPFLRCWSAANAGVHSADGWLKQEPWCGLATGISVKKIMRHGKCAGIRSGIGICHPIWQTGEKSLGDFSAIYFTSGKPAWWKLYIPSGGQCSWTKNWLTH